MKKYKYIVTGACSFGVGNRMWSEYGKLVAKHFNAVNCNKSKSGASITTINRKILKWCSKNRDKFEDTLVIIGLTEVGRSEIWNNKMNGWQNILPGRFQPRPGFSPDGSDQFVKPGWWSVQEKNYYINFYNDDAAFVSAINVIIGLQSFLTLNNIDHIFFDALEPIDTFWEKFCNDKEDKFGHKLLFDNLVSKENWYKHPEYKSILDFTKKNPEMRATKNDTRERHPNGKAHKYWAKCLIEYIEKKDEREIK